MRLAAFSKLAISHLNLSSARRVTSILLMFSVLFAVLFISHAICTIYQLRTIYALKYKTYTSCRHYKSGIGRVSILKMEAAVANVKAKHRRRNQSLIIRVSGAEKLELNQAAAALDVPASQIVRKGIKQALREFKAIANAKTA